MFLLQKIAFINCIQFYNSSLVIVDINKTMDYFICKNYLHHNKKYNNNKYPVHMSCLALFELLNYYFPITIDNI